MPEQLSPAVKRILQRAQVEASSVDKECVEPIHLLLAIIQEGRTAASILLREKGLTEQECRDSDLKK